jgi:ABC-2 type transport system ATP-binding protein
MAPTSHEAGADTVAPMAPEAPAHPAATLPAMPPAAQAVPALARPAGAPPAAHAIHVPQRPAGDPSAIVISAREVSKKFVAHHRRATSFKERFVRRGAGHGEDFWALRDIDVEIGQGQTVGLAGANGSGKSTLLKVLAGILRPTVGQVTVAGRVASLLELGAGFNGELSGRDNVYLNASLLGLSHREIDRMFDSIVDFAELPHKIDDEVKHYSSGQYVRLGFAVAVHVDPDVLLVDEVLAVGDEAFQLKCLAKIAEFRAEGRTILFVTHALDLIENMCDRVIVLESGKKIWDGDPASGTRILRQKLGSLPSEGPVPYSLARVRPVEIGFSRGPGGPRQVQFTPGEPLTISVTLELDDNPPDAVYLHVYVVDRNEEPIWLMETPDGGVPGRAGRTVVDFTVDAVPPLLGAFAVSVHVSDANTGEGITIRRFDELFGVNGPQNGGLLAVDYSARARDTAEEPV